MAAPGTHFVRVRLHFDYPPPAAVDCRQCWLLLDLGSCRVVSDLESIIRQKFEFSRRSILNLFLENCYLPHTESIYVVRDNDDIRVKVDYLAEVNGDSRCPDQPRENCRKRGRHAEAEEPGEEEVSVEEKKKRKKKKKKGSEESLETNAKHLSSDEKRKQSKKKKKKRKKEELKGATVTPKPAAPTQKTPVRSDQPLRSTKKPPAAQKVSSPHSSSSSSEEEEAPRKTAVPGKPSSTPAPKKHPTATPSQTRPRPPPSSSSETSSDEAPSGPLPSQNKPPAPKGALRGTTPSAPQPSAGAQEPAAGSAAPPRDAPATPRSSSSEEEIEFVIRKPTHQPGIILGQQPPGRVRGRGKSRHGGPGERGSAEGRGGIRGHQSGFELSGNGGKEPSYRTDLLTTTSVVLQNGAGSDPKPDYSTMPLLAAPPQVGQKIAFKLLELTENYTPAVSDYKEAKIVNFDHGTKQIELELENGSEAPAEPGKFDLVYQNPDGSETVEYAVTRGSLVTERWDSLLEPRLII